MCSDSKPSIETFKAVMEEYSKNKKVESTKCERCNTVIKIIPKGESALEMRCQCGLYNDTLRGI